MPVVFCVIGYLFLWLALQPVWSTVSATLTFLVSDEAPNFNPELSTIYDPNTFQQSDGDYILGEDIVFPADTEQYGQLVCDQIGLDAPVFPYDSDEILSYGVGQSLISLFPGFGRPIILAGHNTTFFKCLENAAAGNVIQFHTHYGDYEYTVTNVQVYNEDDLEHLLSEKVAAQREELIMYTCYPFHAITGRKTDRLVVFADRTAGKDVKWREEN